MESREKGYGVPETAKILGIAVRTVRQWIADGKIHAVKPGNGKKWMVMESEIDRLMAGK